MRAHHIEHSAVLSLIEQVKIHLPDLGHEVVGIFTHKDIGAMVIFQRVVEVIFPAGEPDAEHARRMDLLHLKRFAAGGQHDPVCGGIVNADLHACAFHIVHSQVRMGIPAGSGDHLLHQIGSGRIVFLFPHVF